MAKYKILESGVEINRIVASESFVQQHYAEYELVIDSTPVATHKKHFSPKELYDSFTTGEALLALKSDNADVRAQAELLIVNRAVTISYEDSGYQSSIDLLEIEGVLSTERALGYRSGIPLVSE